MYQAIPEARVAPDSARNALYALEGPQVTEFACKACHSIGLPAADGSVGQCQKCHLRHEFSLEQVRKPDTCSNCHIGPDHPQWEIYQESPHGLMYLTNGSTWNWSAETGTLKVTDFPAPTCAICHMSGFGASGTTHDVGDRLTWFLFAQTSERRPAWQDNKTRMQTVCLQCHNSNFVQNYYAKADLAVDQVNKWIAESDAIMKPLNDKKLLTDVQFDVPIKFTYFETWHHWGRTTKFGTWMQGPDYTQWHGAYEVLHSLSELRQEADGMLKQAPQ
jgi:hydroxylamine dehydrogenase